jgi:hypothetical protein
MSSQQRSKWQQAIYECNNARGDLQFQVERNADEEVVDHCSELRRQVDVVRETAIQNVWKSSNALFKRIDGYERECLSRNAECSRVREEIRLLLDSSAAVVWRQEARLSDLMRQLDEAQINESIDRLQQQMAEFKAVQRRLTAATFRGAKLSFQSNLDLLREDLSLGEIYNSPVQVPYTLDFAQFKQVTVPEFAPVDGMHICKYAYAMQGGRSLVAFYYTYNMRDDGDDGYDGDDGDYRDNRDDRDFGFKVNGAHLCSVDEQWLIGDKTNARLQAAFSIHLCCW